MAEDLHCGVRGKLLALATVLVITESTRLSKLPLMVSIAAAPLETQVCFGFGPIEWPLADSHFDGTLIGVDGVPEFGGSCILLRPGELWKESSPRWGTRSLLILGDQDHGIGASFWRQVLC
jgi:hypothetical protein